MSEEKIIKFPFLSEDYKMPPINYSFKPIVQKFYNSEKHIEANYGCIDYPVGSYLRDNLRIINRMSSLIKEYSGKNCINLWCTGSSGAIIAALVAEELLKDGRCIYISHIKKNMKKLIHRIHILTELILMWL